MNISASFYRLQKLKLNRHPILYLKKFCETFVLKVLLLLYLFTLEESFHKRRCVLRWEQSLWITRHHLEESFEIRIQKSINLPIIVVVVSEKRKTPITLSTQALSNTATPITHPPSPDSETSFIYTQHTINNKHATSMPYTNLNIKPFHSPFTFTHTHIYFTPLIKKKLCPKFTGWHSNRV